MIFLIKAIYQRFQFYLVILSVFSTAAFVFVSMFAPTFAANAPTLTFNVNPTYIEEGETAVLSWFGQNIKTCQGYGDWAELYHYSDYFARGAYRIHPIVSASYGLSCFGDGGIVRSEVSVNVGRPGAPSYSYPSTVVTSGGSAPVSTITTPAPASTALFAGCAASPTTAIKGEKIIFVGSYIGGSGTANYSWSGDINGVGKIVEKSFSETGAKTANLTVTDSAGRTAGASCPITVIEGGFVVKEEKNQGSVLGTVTDKIKTAVEANNSNSAQDKDGCDCAASTEEEIDSQTAAVGRAQSFVLWFIVALVIINFGFLVYISGRLSKLEKKHSTDVPV